MEKGRIITLGHGLQTLEQIAQLLRHHQITYLVDVRSQPYSKFNPAFSMQPLERFMGQLGFKYVFMGDSLGGRPQDDTVYVNGKVDYGLLKAQDYFQKGIHRLISAYEKGLCLALMCAEASPQNCHRNLLIASELVNRGIAIFHLNESGHLIDHSHLKHPTENQLNLF